MTATFESLLHEALRLPVEDRSRMASCLIESVDDDEALELSPAGQAEIARRVESIRDGTAKLIPHDEVMANVRLKLAEQRASKQA